MQSFRSFAPKRCPLPHRPPLPNFRDVNSKSYEKLENVIHYIGKFNGLSVVVENYEDMVNLYTMGYFGKGSLSSGYPSFIKKRKTLEVEDSENGSTVDSQAQKCDSLPTTSQETLNLMLEEAFFLSYALGILDVHYNDEVMTNESMWIQFQNIVPDFIPRYVAYHHFRSKGWVVKPGIKFGGDFTLYKEGPPFYHASFVVRITYNLKDTDRHQEFGIFLAHYRAIEVVKKDLLICQIVAPQDFEKKNLNDMEKFKVSEYLFRRWAPSENRE